MIEIKRPPIEEEMDVFLQTMYNPDGIFLGSEEDLGKLFQTVDQLFPHIRDLIKDKTKNDLYYILLEQIN